MRVAAAALLLAWLPAPGCVSDLPPLPPSPGDGGALAAPPPTDPGLPPTPGDALTPSRSGDVVLPGVVVLDPVLDPEAATASFRVRNDGERDLPDLILAVIFAVPGGGEGGEERPRFETIEVPLRRGETRELRVALSTRSSLEVPTGFRVAAGLPEVLTAGGEGMPGTTFLGGLLECVLLDVDLTADRRRVTVGLAERGAAAGGAPLPPLEGQLLCARAGELVWTGPWILVPRADPDGGKARRIRWNLDGAGGIAGCDLFLRIREKR